MLRNTNHKKLMKLTKKFLTTLACAFAVTGLALFSVSCEQSATEEAVDDTTEAVEEAADAAGDAAEGAADATKDAAQ